MITKKYIYSGIFGRNSCDASTAVKVLLIADPAVIRCSHHQKGTLLHLTLQRKRPLICLKTNFLGPLSSHGSSRHSTNPRRSGLRCNVPFQQMNVKIKLCTSTKLKNPSKPTNGGDFRFCRQDHQWEDWLFLN